MTNKLPVFFEELLDVKFAETNKKIDDLKLHVNDELASFKKQMIVMWIISISLLVLHIDQYGVGFIASLKKFIGL